MVQSKDAEGGQKLAINQIWRTTEIFNIFLLIAAETDLSGNQGEIASVNYCFPC